MSNKSRYFLVPIATAVAALVALPVSNANASSSNIYKAQQVVGGAENSRGLSSQPGLSQLISSNEIHSLVLSNSETGMTLASHRSHSSHSSHSSHRSHFSSR